MKLVMENIRSFAGRTEFEIRPLTLLVGENSSGKFTFLAALAAVSDPVWFPNVATFNKAPYNLGTFDTLATYRGGRGGRAKSFALGYRIEVTGYEEGMQVVATYGSEDGEARLEEVNFTLGTVSTVHRSRPPFPN